MEKPVGRPRGVTNLNIIDWITFVFLVLGLFGVLIPLLVTPPYPITGGRIGGGVAGVSVIAVLVILTGFALVAISSAKPWGKTYHYIYSIAMLILAFPVGTVLQGLALYYLSKPEVKSYFRERPPNEPPGRKAA